MPRQASDSDSNSESSDSTESEEYIICQAKWGDKECKASVKNGKKYCGHHQGFLKLDELKKSEKPNDPIQKCSECVNFAPTSKFITKNGQPTTKCEPCLEKVRKKNVKNRGSAQNVAIRRRLNNTRGYREKSNAKKQAENPEAWKEKNRERAQRHRDKKSKE